MDVIVPAAVGLVALILLIYYIYLLVRGDAQ